jgi:sulfite reductase (NADPH) hemoprotein beta-component
VATVAVGGPGNPQHRLPDGYDLLPRGRLLLPGQRRFDNLDYLYDLGPLELNISGCMNACGHHHIGHIGILGVDKKGQEFYQVCLGGSQAKDASIGKILGPSFKQEDMPEVIDRILSTYVGLREEEETFLDTYRRVGIDPFKERVYAKAD